ncbi:GIY-YIG nuclease family protein [Rhizobium sp.]|uniref:GIY-YIG nuclease family protein n=1 Tax=Rhizobium sp. TaxID=391 RepID=UPI0028AA50A3
MNNNQNCGVYIFTHVDTGRSYIGASSNLKRRKYHHYRSLHLGNAKTTEMLIDFQNSAVGNSAMDFRVIEYCDQSNLAEREKAYIETRNPEYNTKRGGAGIRVVKEDFREKQRERWTGRQMRVVGVFTTPWGEFSSSNAAAEASGGLISQPAVWTSCTRASKVITRTAWSKSIYLQTKHDESVVGKAWSDLGFGFQAD